MFEVQPHEIATRKLFSEAMDRISSDENHSQWVARLVVAKVFIAMNSYSLNIERIQGIAQTLEVLCVSGPINLKKELAALVREKVLRSRMISGERHWEVNY